MEFLRHFKMPKDLVFDRNFRPPLYVGAPVLLAQEEVRSTPQWKPQWPWSMRVATENHSKIAKIDFFENCSGVIGES